MNYRGHTVESDKLAFKVLYLTPLAINISNVRVGLILRRKRKNVRVFVDMYFLRRKLFSKRVRERVTLCVQRNKKRLLVTRERSVSGLRGLQLFLIILLHRMSCMHFRIDLVGTAFKKFFMLINATVRDSCWPHRV